MAFFPAGWAASPDTDPETDGEPDPDTAGNGSPVQAGRTRLPCAAPPGCGADVQGSVKGAQGRENIS
tara:strand:- start:2123 stop:2323 length:201 start_codon:yes stop_codon:yes gene_type:complete